VYCAPESWTTHHPSASAMQSLHQAFAIHESNDDVPVPRTDAAIDD
jgi:hypothetical protein